MHYIDHIAEACRQLCDRYTLRLIIGFSVVYFLITGWIATQKMLWNDELFTLYIAKLASLSDIVAALSTGADQQPPSFYLLTHCVMSFLGASELSVRLPEIFGVWLMSLCLFRFVSKHLPALYGFAAMMFSLVTIAYEYAYEARPYGLVLGFSSLALICWQEVSEGWRRMWWLVGLAISSAAAVFSHYYAIFLLIPLGIGEIVRSISQRRIDIPVWIALGCTLLPLLLFLSFLQQANTYSSHFWAIPKWGMIPGFYYYLLIPTVGPIIAMLIVSSLLPAGESSYPSPTSHGTKQPPSYEIAAALGFIVIPFIAVSIAKLVTGAFTYRYALSAVIGFSILCAIAVHRLHGERAIIGVSFTLFTSIWFLVTAMIQLQRYATTTASWSKAYEFIQSENDDAVPIVAADLQTFMTLSHYAPPNVSSRVVYLADPQASMRYFCHDSVDRGILDLKPWFPVQVEKYGPYIQAHDRFLIYAPVRGERSWMGFFWGEPWNLNWVLYELRNAPVRIELKGRNDDDVLFLVTKNTHERSPTASADEAPTEPRVRPKRKPHPQFIQTPCQ